VTVFEDLVLDRTIDPLAGIAMLDSPVTRAASDVTAPAARAAAPVPAPVLAARGSSPSATTASTTWSAAATVSAQVNAGRAAASSPGSPMAAPIPLPQRLNQFEVQVDQPTPEPGDIVDHFAFGRCEVIKSDGDRLHLRVPKDGRIREIALEMLRVTPLENEGEVRRFKLERRI
jgi:hypothetical protein